MGTPKKTYAAKALDGNPGKRSDLPRAKASIARPRMPRKLSKESRLEWRRVVSVLEEEGRLNIGATSLLIDHCTVWARLLATEDDLTERGLLIKGQRGMVKNPSIQIGEDFGGAAGGAGGLFY